MERNFENKLKLGIGIYTMPDMAKILRLPDYKVRRWINTFWDDRFAKNYNEKYSWTIDNSKAVSFHTLVEFSTFSQLIEAGVKAKEIIKAHEILSKEFDTAFPLATSKVLGNMHTDGKKIYFEYQDKTITCLDGLKQLNMDFIKLFFKKLDFGNSELAIKLWPLGHSKSVVCDPNRKFGQPVIDGTNILANNIFDLKLSGESIDSIKSLFSLTTKQVKDAIEFGGTIH